MLFENTRKQFLITKLVLLIFYYEQQIIIENSCQTDSKYVAFKFKFSFIFF